MNKSSISVIIPNYNGKELLKKNLPLIIDAKNNKANRISEVIIIDDGSKDDSVEYIMKNYPQIKLLQNIHNKGFAHTVNRGVLAATSELVCLLNTDVKPTINFLESLDGFFRNEKIFGVSLHEIGQGFAVGIFKDGYFQHKDVKGYEKVMPALWVSGGSGVYRKSIWIKLGGFDQELYFPFYWEDVDIGYRALKRGYELFWNPNSSVRHNHSTTISKTISRSKIHIIVERNQLLFIWKNITSNSLIFQHILGLMKRLIRHPGYIKVILSALRRIRHVMQQRKSEVLDSVVTDEEIFAAFKNYYN